MTETRKNLLRDVMCSVENLQDCLDVLLHEEESCAARLSGKPKKAAQYDASMQAWHGDRIDRYSGEECRAAMVPREILWIDENGEEVRYPIDRIKDVCQAAAERAGGQGDRYTILVNGRETYLFF